MGEKINPDNNFPIQISINSLIIFLKTKIKWNVLPLQIPSSVFSKLSGLLVKLTIFYYWSRLYYWPRQQGKSEEKYLVLSHHQLVFISVCQRDFTGCDLTETWVLLETKSLITMSRTLLDVKCKKMYFQSIKYIHVMKTLFLLWVFFPLRCNLLHRFIYPNIKL